MTTYYPPESGRIEQSSSLDVVEIVLNQNLSLKDFLIKPEPNMILRDVNVKKSYRVGEDGQSLTEIPETRQPEPERGSFNYLLLLVLCAILLAVGFTVRKTWWKKLLGPSK